MRTNWQLGRLAGERHEYDEQKQSKVQVAAASAFGILRISLLRVAVMLPGNLTSPRSIDSSLANCDSMAIACLSGTDAVDRICSVDRCPLRRIQKRTSFNALAFETYNDR